MNWRKLLVRVEAVMIKKMKTKMLFLTIQCLLMAKEIIETDNDFSTLNQKVQLNGDDLNNINSKNKYKEEMWIFELSQCIAN